LIEGEISPTGQAGSLTLTVKDLPKPPKPPGPAAKVDPKKVVYPPTIKPADYDDTTPVFPKVGDNVVTWDLKIGSLPSGNVISGVQARLLNLGFRAAMETPAAVKTKAGVTGYQKKYKMTESGTSTDIEASIRNKHDNI